MLSRSRLAYILTRTSTSSEALHKSTTPIPIDISAHHELLPYRSRSSASTPCSSQGSSSTQRICRGCIGQGRQPGTDFTVIANFLQIKLSLALPHQVRLKFGGYGVLMEFCKKEGHIGRRARRGEDTGIVDILTNKPSTVSVQVRRCRPGQHSRRIRRDGYSCTPRSIH